MHFVKGKSRFVIVLPGDEIVIKIARIRLVSAFRYIWCALMSPKDTREYIRIESRTEWWYWSSSVKNPLFAGFMENWREYMFYRRTKLKILQPTFYSIGFVNIQKYATPFGYDVKGFWEQMIGAIGWVRLGFDGHHFSNPTNFAERNGKLAVLDYGNPRTRTILFRCADKLWNDFDTSKVTEAP